MHIRCVSHDCASSRHCASIRCTAVGVELALIKTWPAGNTWERSGPQKRSSLETCVSDQDNQKGPPIRSPTPRAKKKLWASSALLHVLALAFDGADKHLPKALGIKLGYPLRLFLFYRRKPKPISGSPDKTHPHPTSQPCGFTRWAGGSEDNLTVMVVQFGGMHQTRTMCRRQCQRTETWEARRWPCVLGTCRKLSAFERSLLALLAESEREGQKLEKNVP